MQKLKFEYRFLIIYLILGGLWILFSDAFLSNLITEINILTRLQTYKGWFYVAVTAILFFVLLKRHLVKLRKAEYDARESDRLKSAFLQNISHEIRTPMNGIMGFSQLLDADNLTHDQRKEYIRIINNSSNRLLSVVNDILEISLIESGKIQVHENHVDINELLTELNEIFRPRVKPTTQLICNCPLSIPDSVIVTDKEKLHQVLYNLLNNAVKFTEKGKIEFGYTVKDKMLEFFVSDTGIGIETSQHKKIFDSFHKNERNTENLYDGIGLGLSISKGNLKVLGGDIWVESAPGAGAAFFFNLPYKKVLHPVIENNTLKQAEKKRIKILVFEDDEISFEFIKAVLYHEEITLIHAWDGKEGLQIYEKNKDIEFILLDIKLPGMNGYDVLKAIRKTNTSIPVIAQTAYATEEEREKAMDSGFNNFISKPYKKNEFLSMVNTYLSKN